MPQIETSDRTDGGPFFEAEDAVALGGLFLLSAGVFLVHFLYPYVINPDAIVYIESAKAVHEGDYAKAFSLVKPSIFPALIAYAYKVFGDWLTAARFFPIAFGMLAIVPLYWVSREVVGRKNAWIPPFFYCISPEFVRVSLQIVRDTGFTLIFVIYLFVIIKAIKKDNPVLYGVAGGLALAGATLRVNGILLIVFCFLFCLYLGIVWTKKYLKSFLNACCTVLPAVLVLLIGFGSLNLSSDRLAAVRHDLLFYAAQGKSILLGKDIKEKDVFQAIAESDSPKIQRLFRLAWEERGVVAMFRLLNRWAHGSWFCIFLFVLLGMAAKPDWKSPIWQFIIAFMVLWLLMGFVRLTATYSISARHLFPLVLAGYFYGAKGVRFLSDKLKRRIPKLPENAAIAGVILLILVFTLPETLTDRNKNVQIQRQAGEWIRTLDAGHFAIVTNWRRTAFYAGADKWMTDDRSKPDSIEAEGKVAVIERSIEKDFFPEKEIAAFLDEYPGDRLFIVFGRSAKTDSRSDWIENRSKPRWRIEQSREFSNEKETAAVFYLVKNVGNQPVR